MGDEVEDVLIPRCIQIADTGIPYHEVNYLSKQLLYGEAYTELRYETNPPIYCWDVVDNGGAGPGAMIYASRG